MANAHANSLKFMTDYRKKTAKINVVFINNIYIVNPV
jgi:hypothetical protein